MKHREVNTESAAEKRDDGNLLRTYFTSLLSCFICCVMFLGTTFAWFSGSVSSVSNRIQAGNLQIQLICGEKNLTEDPTYQAFSTDALAPGGTITRMLTVKNSGNMKLKYDLNMAVVDNNPLAQNFTVTVTKGDVFVQKTLINGLPLSSGTLDPGQSETFSVKLTLNSSDQSIQGQKLQVVLCLAAQQVTGNGGIG